MLARILVGVLLIPAVVALVLWAPAWLVAVAAAGVVFVALHEFFALAGRMGFKAYRVWTFLCVAGIVFAQWSADEGNVRHFAKWIPVAYPAAAAPGMLEAMLLIFALGSAAIGVFSRDALVSVLPSVAVSSAGVLLVALPFSYLVRLRAMPENGPQLVLFTLAIVWAGDILAYAAGASIGKMRMAPALSPKKTWEGAVASIVGAIVVGACFSRWLRMGLLPVLGVAVAANIAGQVGDLIESAYKRGAGVKDSGSLLPGHGGMLDRIDSLILATPVVWLAAQWMLQ